MMSNANPAQDEGHDRKILSLTCKIQRLLLHQEPLTIRYLRGSVWPDMVGSGELAKGVIVGTYTRSTPQDWIREDLEEVMAEAAEKPGDYILPGRKDKW